MVWSYKTQELKLAESIDGKWLVLSTDDALDANEVVNEYLKKDSIEKIFHSAFECDRDQTTQSMVRTQHLRCSDR